MSIIIANGTAEVESNLKNILEDVSKVSIEEKNIFKIAISGINILLIFKTFYNQYLHSLRWFGTDIFY